MTQPSYPGPWDAPPPGQGWAAPPPGGQSPPPWTQDAPAGQPVPYGVSYPPPAPYARAGYYAYLVPGSPLYADVGAPFGRDPRTGQALSDKSKVAAGLLQLFFGTLGVGRFYTGHIGIALGQLLLTVVGWMLVIVVIGAPIVIGAGIWALIDGIVLLSTRSTDARGLLLRP